MSKLSARTTIMTDRILSRIDANNYEGWLGVFWIQDDRCVIYKEA